MARSTIYTIGHSTHPIERFQELLSQHSVTAIADVRSAPYSKYNPQYNREALALALREAEVGYVFLGRELGARSSDPSCYDKGQVQYDRLAMTDLFKQGLERLFEQAGDYRIALMCAEKDPLACHRTILVARHLVEGGAQIQHILEDGALESHAEAMQRLRAELDLPERDLFRSPEEMLAEAYALQAAKIAYTEKDAPVEQPDGELAMKIYTIGFTQKPAEAFFTLLRESGAKRIVDVRLNNSSQLAGFAKRDDLRYFLKEVCGMEYVHLPELAPTQEMLDEYKKNKGDWSEYEKRFLGLIESRKIEETVPREVIDGGCLLCSEHQPHHCHRRLVAEYLKERWGEGAVEHLT